MTSPTPGRAAPCTVVGLALLDDDEHPRLLLAARRTAPAALAGLWEFPGGKVEPGEEVRDALVREVREELGVSVRLGAEVLADDAEGWPLAGGARMRVVYGVLTPDSPEPEPLEDHDVLRWTVLEPDALHALAWIPADRPIVDALLRQLPGAFPTS